MTHDELKSHFVIRVSQVGGGAGVIRLPFDFSISSFVQWGRWSLLESEGDVCAKAKTDSR